VGYADSASVDRRRSLHPFPFSGEPLGEQIKRV
jgi:hypothetical protein